MIAPFLGFNIGFNIGDVGVESVPDFEIVTNVERDLLLNAVNQFNPEELRPLALLPTLNLFETRRAYDGIINTADETIHHVNSRNGCMFFFYKVRGQVYQIITNHNLTMVRGVTIIDQ